MRGGAVGGDEALLKEKLAKRQKLEAEKALQGEEETPAQNGVKKEDVKKDEDDVKKEDDDVKKEEDVKEEVKEEEEEEADDWEDLLEDTGPTEPTSSKKRKRRETEDEEGLPDVPDTPAIDTDTEYTDEIKLSSYPAKLRIEACSYEKVNGLYRIMRTPSRGRPAYCKTTNLKDKKNVFLFYSGKKTGRWHVGFEFGARRCVASIQDNGLTDPPVEPYPASWKVVEKHSTDNSAEGGKKDKDKMEKVRCITMRVIDAAVWKESHSLQDIDQPLEKEAAQEAALKKGVADKAKAENDRTEKQAETSAGKAAEKQSTKPKQQSTPVQSSSSQKGPQRKTAKKGASADQDDEAALVEAAAKAQDEDSDDDQKAKKGEQSDSNETASESESDESSSSDSTESHKGHDDADELKDMSANAKALVVRLKGFSQAEAIAKVKKLWFGFEQRMKKGQPMHHNCSIAQSEEVRTWVTRHLALTLPPIKERPVPVQPKPAAGTSQPQTPPAEQVQEAPAQRESAQMPHRTEAPKKSVLKNKGSARNTRRITIASVGDDRNIAAYKSFGERLWYQSPGSMVQCDFCSQWVPQQMGMLQGAHNRSQFAQSTFCCAECAQRPDLVPQ